MVNIATLLFSIKTNNDKSQFPMVPKMLKELVPADQLKAMSENEWKKVCSCFIRLGPDVKVTGLHVPPLLRAPPPTVGAVCFTACLGSVSAG